MNMTNENSSTEPGNYNEVEHHRRLGEALAQKMRQHLASFIEQRAVPLHRWEDDGGPPASGGVE
jgi:hypothetical protein